MGLLFCLYMATIDIIILIFIGIGTVLGMIKGFIRQLSSLVGLVVGLLVARALFAEVGYWMVSTIGVPETIAQLLAFFMLWIAVPILFSLFASFLSRALEVVHLGWINRWLGAGLGTVKFMLIIGLVGHLFEFIDADHEMLPQRITSESVLYQPLYDFVGTFIPAIKNAGEQIMNVGSDYI